ncbi:30S ribosomal protein S6 [Sediminitomix flava]|nr:30S ribosomal protein S6 [Sediminitomix flava]
MKVKNYEAVFIISPVLSEEQIKEAVDKFSSLLKDSGADVYHSEDWGLRKLAYPIEKKSTGFYQLFEFKASPEVIAKFELELKRDERVLRFLTVSLDKYGVEYNERRRNGLGKKSETKTEEVA